MRIGVEQVRGDPTSVHDNQVIEVVGKFDPIQNPKQTSAGHVRFDIFDQRVFFGLVENGGRLIHYQEVRLFHKGSGDCDFLPLRTR